jgi:hypothetical protein
MIFVIICLFLIIIAIITAIITKDEEFGLSDAICCSVVFAGIASVLIVVSTCISLAVNKTSTYDTFTAEDIVEVKETPNMMRIELENEKVYIFDGSIEIKEGATYEVKRKECPLWVSICFTCFLDKALTENQTIITVTYNPNEVCN